jgi:glycosyltransferase involved in cell wall biosynthesis
VQKTSPHIAVCIPTYNNAATISDVVTGVLKHCRMIVVVDDGSTDATHKILNTFPSITVIRFARNRGKGNALKAGIDQAAVMGATHVITLDGDGQHIPDDLALFIDKIKSDTETLWIGNRIIPSGGVEPPARSRLGRKIGNFWYHFNTGISLHDTQCGFRAYPLALTRGLDIKGHRYEYEQDALIKAAWNGVAVREVDIHLNYQDENIRISHFRPVRDFFRISAINSRAAFLRVAFPVLTMDARGRTLGEKIQAIIRYELLEHATPKRAAFSLAFGVFISIFPIHGFQVATLMGLSVILRLNRPLAFLGVCVSSPPFIPLIIVAAVAIGRIVVPGDFISHGVSFATRPVLQGGVEFIVGSVILSVAAGMATMVVAYPVFVKLNAYRRMQAGKKQ